MDNKEILKYSTPPAIMSQRCIWKGSIPMIPLAFQEPRWMWWAFDLYMLKPMYKYLMLPGRF